MWLYIFLLFIIVLLLLSGFLLLPGPSTQRLPGEIRGGYDLKEYDFSDRIYVTGSVWESWPEKLYTPAQLRQAGSSVSQQDVDYKNTQVITYRMQLELPPGQT